MIIKTYNRNTDRFFKFCQEEMNKHGVKFQVSLHPYVLFSKNSKCNGFFDEDRKVLAVAFGRDFTQSLSTMVHEFSHFTQWVNQTPEWVKYIAIDGDDDYLDKWISNKLKNTAKNRKVIKIAKTMELECEMITLRFIKKFNLPIDSERYAKQANAYGCFYDYILKARAWYKIGKEPYNNEQILKLMPSKIKNIKMNKELESLYKSCC